MRLLRRATCGCDLLAKTQEGKRGKNIPATGKADLKVYSLVVSLRGAWEGLKGFYLPGETKESALELDQVLTLLFV
jgi:hypothetical protein